jgi:hypothetical protein
MERTSLFVISLISRILESTQYIMVSLVHVLSVLLDTRECKEKEMTA